MKLLYVFANIIKCVQVLFPCRRDNMLKLTHHGNLLSYTHENNHTIYKSAI